MAIYPFDSATSYTQHEVTLQIRVGASATNSNAFLRPSRRVVRSTYLDLAALCEDIDRALARSLESLARRKELEPRRAEQAHPKRTPFALRPDAARRARSSPPSRFAFYQGDF